ncbi:helix-turn-helix domain-containing protein [Streptomyces sp. NPDC003952]
MERGKWYGGADRRRIAAQLREWYEDGASIRDLAELTGRSYGFLHRLLLESGAILRGRGGDNTRNWRPPPAP